MFKFAALIAICLQLQGCFFFFIVPDSLPPLTKAWCVNPFAMPGQEIQMVDGRKARVISISGESERCQDPRYPLRAKLDFG